jgi:hypothetical protein
MGRGSVLESRGRLAPPRGRGGDTFPKLGNIGTHAAFSISETNAMVAQVSVGGRGTSWGGTEEGEGVITPMGW